MKSKLLLLILHLAIAGKVAYAQASQTLKMLQSAYPGHTVETFTLFGKVYKNFISVKNDTTELFHLFDTTGKQLNPVPLHYVHAVYGKFLSGSNADGKSGFFSIDGSWSTPFKYTHYEVLENDGQVVMIGDWRKDYYSWGDPFFDCYDDKGVTLISNCDGTVYKTGPNIIIAKWPISRKMQERFRAYDFSGKILFETEKYAQLGLPNNNGELWALETSFSGSSFDVIDLKGKKIRKYKYPDGTRCPCEKFDPDFLSFIDKDETYYIIRGDGKRYPLKMKGGVTCPRGNTVIVRNYQLFENHGKYFSTTDYGLCDLYGNKLVDIGKEEIGEFSEGLIPVKQDGVWGYLDSMGNTIIPFKYSKAGPFINGTAMVSLDGNSFAIDKTGYSKNQCTSGDCLNGLGSMVENGVIYNGEFRDGQKDGYGYEITDGIEYKGTWYQGKKTGKGYINISKENYTIDYEYQDGKPYHARIQIRAGSVFEGTFSEDRQFYTGTLLMPSDGNGTINHLPLQRILEIASQDNVFHYSSQQVRKVNERLHNHFLEEMASSWAEQEEYQYQRIQAESQRIRQQQAEIEAYRQQRQQEKEAQRTQQSNTNSGSNACGCCGGSGQKLKLVPEFHKTGERRIERPKPNPSGGGSYIVEVYYEPIGYTTYRSEYESCSCCGGSGKR